MGELKKAYRHLELQNQIWLNQRVAWIVDQFGRDHIARVECMLPNSKRLAEYRGGTDEEVIEFFRKITVDVGLDPDKIDFFIEDQLKTGDGSDALGLYLETQQGRFSIAIATDQLSDPCDLAATLVHELCHVHLMGHRRIDGPVDDNEPLTDLLCIFMGYGIIAANSVLYDRTEGIGAIRQWQMGRKGYMSMSMFGYGLALFARLRHEDGQQWRRYMRADVRDAFDHALRYFEQNGQPDLSHVPGEFIEPVLTIDTTPAPPPDNVMAAIYRDDVEYEIAEIETDYPVDQTDSADDTNEPTIASDQAPETTESVSECIYCGSTSGLSQIILPAIDEVTVCRECRESIEVGEREAAELAEQEGRASHFVPIILIGSLVFMALSIVWIVINAAMNE